MDRATSQGSSVAERRVLLGLWAAVVVQVAGRVLDGLWHTSHDEFETTSDQLEAHWLIWLGVLLALVVAFVALRSLGSSPARSAYLIVAAAGVGYVVTASWHFYEHSQHSDPAAVHVLVGISWAALLAGVVAATVISRRTGRPER